MVRLERTRARTKLSSMASHWLNKSLDMSTKADLDRLILVTLGSDKGMGEVETSGFEYVCSPDFAVSLKVTNSPK